MKRSGFKLVLMWEWASDAVRELGYQFRIYQPDLRVQPYEESGGDIAVSQSVISSKVASALSEKSLRLSLFYYELLRGLKLRNPSTLSGQSLASIKILDIGCLNLAYLPGVATAIRESFVSDVIYYLGIEVDPGRMYSNFYKREDQARYMADLASEKFGSFSANYLEQDWLGWREDRSFNFIFSFFPFLFEDLSDRFGLPRKYFDPVRFYQKAGFFADQLVFAHQGDLERERSLELIHQVGGKVLEERRVFENPWLPRKHPVWVISWEPRSKFIDN